MRHRKGFNHLGRTSAHRKAMMANMATSLIMNKRITTTTAKAKALRTYVEPLITKSKEDTTHSRRVVFSYLRNKYAVSELFREISPKIADRPGGYTRILKLGNRLGDNADMCIIELVDYNENMLGEGKSGAKSTRRRRGGKKKSADAEVTKAEETVNELTETEVQPEEISAGVETIPEAEMVAEEDVKADEKAETAAQDEEVKDKTDSNEKEETKAEDNDAAKE